MTGPAGAFGLTALQLLGGVFLFLWAASLRYKTVNRGYLRSTVWVLWPLMLATAFALPGSLQTLGIAAAAVWALYLGAVYIQRPLAEWAAGAAGSLAALLLLGQAGAVACTGSCVLAVLHALLGGLFLGGITHGMALGHWYLNQARLPIEPLKEQTNLLIGVLAVSAVAGVATRTHLLEGEVPGGVMAYSAGAYWWTWALLMAGTAVLMGMIRATVRDRSTQSATGLLYIASLTALAAQFLIDLLVAT